MRLRFQLTWLAAVCLVSACDQAPSAPPPMKAAAKGEPARARELPADAPSLGPSAAKVTLVAFSDFECHYCAKAAPTLKKLAEKYGNDLRIVFRHQPLAMHKRAQLAAEATMAAHKQGKFWEFHDALFAEQASLERADLERQAEKLGLDLVAFRKALDERSFQKRVESDAKDAVLWGVSGTPTFFINGTRIAGALPLERFEAVIDEELGQANALMKGGTRVEDIHSVRSAQTERAPAPSGPVVKPVSVGNAPTLGPAEAPVTIIVFSDFQCPFCAKGANLVHRITEAYGDKVRFAFKHYPLPNHADAPLAAAASVAAQQQGKFWEYHDALFAAQKELNRESLERRAEKLGLNLAAFKTAIDAPATRAAVAADLAEGKAAGIPATPTLLVNGRAVVGAQPVEAMKALIDEELKKVARN